MSGRTLDWQTKPEAYKEYPGAPRTALATPRRAEGPPVWDVIAARRSVRSFSATPIRAEDLSQMLWAAQGITARRSGYAFRTAPSAGALYPVETYVVVHSVTDVPPAVYHYAVRSHELELLRGGDHRRQVARAALDQGIAYEANAVFVWTAVFERSKWKYEQRAYRYVYLDAGHIAQNIALSAVGVGLGSCQIAAFYDEEVNALLGLDGMAESAIYMTVVGRPVG